MKPTKTSLIYHLIGAVLFFTAGILSTLTNDDFLFAIGSFSLCIMWILGIEYDLYYFERNQQKVKNYFS